MMTCRSGTSLPVTRLHRVPPEVSKCIYDWINSMALRNLHSLSVPNKKRPSDESVESSPRLQFKGCKPFQNIWRLSMLFTFDGEFFFDVLSYCRHSPLPSLCWCLESSRMLWAMSEWAMAKLIELKEGQQLCAIVCSMYPFWNSCVNICTRQMNLEFCFLGTVVWGHRKMHRLRVHVHLSEVKFTNIEQGLLDESRTKASPWIPLGDWFETYTLPIKERTIFGRRFHPDPSSIYWPGVAFSFLQCA